MNSMVFLWHLNSLLWQTRASCFLLCKFGHIRIQKYLYTDCIRNKKIYLYQILCNQALCN